MSSKNLFTKSLPKKKFNYLEGFAKEKLHGSGFKDSFADIHPTFEFHSELVKKSINSKEYKFTNFLSNKTNHSITSRIQELAEDPSILNNDSVMTVNMNEKIKSCINLYCEIDSDDNPIIYKSELRDIFGTRNSLRIFCMIDIVMVENSPKAINKIVLIDPFHLVIPSQHNGMTKEKAEAYVYRENSGNTLCLSKYISWVFV
jgi:hypothetical protein